MNEDFFFVLCNFVATKKTEQKPYSRRTIFDGLPSKTSLGASED